MSLGFSDKENLPPLFNENIVHGKETPDLPHERDSDAISEIDSLSATNDSRHSKVPSIQDFVLLKPISRGAFGKVFLGYKRNKPSKKYAIKIMKKADMIHKNMVHQVIAERNALAVSKSPFIVRLFYSLQSRENIYLVMEYMIGGDVKSLLTIYGFFEEEMAVLFTAEVTAALEYLHSHSIVHRDLKPDNMLIASDGHIKLTDFGLSQVKLNRQINIADVMGTPGIQRLTQPADYLRTPGQILSLTSNFAFSPTSRKIFEPYSSSKISPCKSPFRSPHPKLKGSMVARMTTAVHFHTSPQTNCTPPPIRSLTPTLTEAQSWMSTASEQSSMLYIARAASRASACSKIESLVIDDSAFLPNSTVSTPRSSVHGNTSSMKSFAAENMKSLREGMISSEMPPPSSGSRHHSSGGRDSNQEEKDSDSSFGSIELRRKCESGGSPDFASKKMCFSTEDLEGNTALGGRKRSFHCVEKSPRGPEGFGSPSKHTGMTGDFYGVSLGDEHRLKRCNISEIESDCEESSAPSQHLDFSKLDNSLVGSDSGELGSPLSDKSKLVSPKTNVVCDAPDGLKGLITTPPQATITRHTCKDSILLPSFLQVPLGRDKSMGNQSASSAEALSTQRTSLSSESASLSSGLHNMSLDDHALVSPSRLSHSGEGSVGLGHEIKKVSSCPNLLEHDRIRSIRFAEKQFVAMLSETEADCSSLNDADVSNLSGISGASMTFRNKLFKKTVARDDRNLDLSMDMQLELKPRLSRKSESSAIDECDNAVRGPRVLHTGRVSHLCPRLSRSLSLPNAVTDTDTSGIYNTPISPSRHQATCFHTPVREAPQTPFRTPKSVRRGAPLNSLSERILGTPDYLAPELLLQKEHGECVDWWALGVCLYEFLTGVPPFNDTTPEAVFQNILNRDMIWPEGEEALSPHASDAIDRLLDMDSNTRPKAAELKQHPLLQHIDWWDIHSVTPMFVPTPDDDTDTSYFDARNNMQDLKVSAVDLSV